ncbi:ABC transporter permease protein YxdM [Peptococcaceae bacterium CEB3]|nr:ABC transporter permease protein YxdM [Peptococcaceae bacterium CEB3]
MSLWQLVRKNVRGHLHDYLAFFLSSIFSVTIFYLFSAFIYHPAVLNGYIYGGKEVRLALQVLEYVIAIFSFFFILYSINAFLHARRKELALFSLFGMNKGQIKRMILLENGLIGFFAVLAGIALGIMFSKLFFMGLSVLLQVKNPLGFVVPLRAVGLTALVFLLLFFGITWVALLPLASQSVIEGLQESRKPKSLPLFSCWLTLVSLLCLGGGYYWAARVTTIDLLVSIPPVILLVTVGTYFLYTQGSIALLHGLRRRGSFYYRGTNLLTVSQLMFRLKDNARVLFTVSILSAVILTASGTLFSMYQRTTAELVGHFPQTIGFVQKGTQTVVAPGKVEDIEKQDGISVAYRARLVGVPVTLPEVAKGAFAGTRSLEALAVSAKDYNFLAERVPDRKTATPSTGQGVLVLPYPEMKNQVFYPAGETVTVRAGNSAFSLTMEGQRSGAVALPVQEATFLLVLNGADYQKILAQTSAADRVTVYGYEWNHWEKDQGSAQKIRDLVPPRLQNRFLSRIQPYLQAKQTLALTIFIGLFVSALFFLAAGSMLYFKLFTEWQEDREQYRALRRIGVTLPEIRRVMGTQIALLYFLPCLVGTVHMLVAMKALGTVLAANVWGYAGVVIVLFFVMQTLYFLMARHTYWRRMSREAL